VLDIAAAQNRGLTNRKFKGVEQTCFIQASVQIDAKVNLRQVDKGQKPVHVI